MRNWLTATVSAATIAGFFTAAGAQDAAEEPIERGEPMQVITAFGLEPVYETPVQAWNYVNVEAPVDGMLRASAFGSFDTLNPYTLRGDAAAGLGLTTSSLGIGSADEVSVYYANMAESYELADDRSWLIINLRQDAYFHDGHPITSEDVIFTYDTLINDAHPGYRLQLYAAVESYEALDDYSVRITFNDTTDPEAIFGPATAAILPAHYWEGRDFTELTLEPPLGSGPYRIAGLEAGQWIELERVDDWWGAELPSYRGLFNFDRIRYDYYRDNTIQYEALRAGAFDYMGVTDPAQWVNGFDGTPAVENGSLLLTEIPYDGPETWGGLRLNIRRAPLDDIRVRQAIFHLFDFEAANRTILFGLYERSTSIFQNSEFAAVGLPTDGELALLDPHRDALPDAVFGEAILPPVTDASGRNRAQLRVAIDLLRDAGYALQDGVMVHAETGTPLRLELLYGDPSIERMLVHYQNGLDRAGIDLELRFAQGAQWQSAYDSRDYDAIVGFTRALYPPGRFLRDFYGSATADIEGSQNSSGIADPVLDDLIDHVIRSQTWDERINASRAFDRYLRHLYLSVPFYYDPSVRIAHWDMLGRPETRPRFGFSIATMWWLNPSNPAALYENR